MRGDNWSGNRLSYSSKNCNTTANAPNGFLWYEKIIFFFYYLTISRRKAFFSPRVSWGQHSGAVVLVWIRVSMLSLCSHGFSPHTLACSNSPKTCMQLGWLVIPIEHASKRYLGIAEWLLVWIWMWIAVCLYTTALQQTGNPYRVYPTSHPATAGIGSKPTVTQNGISRKDEWTG